MSKIKKFVAVKGSRLNNEQAQIIGEELELIKQNNGQLTPEAIVRQAKAKKSRLHGFFDWDDKTAAGQYRISQARYLLRSIEVHYVAEKSEPKSIKAFYSVTNKTDKKEERIYVSLGDMVKNKDYRQQVIERARREMVNWANRYRQYQELSPVVAAIDKLQNDEKKAA